MPVYVIKERNRNRDEDSSRGRDESQLIPDKGSFLGKKDNFSTILLNQTPKGLSSSKSVKNLYEHSSAPQSNMKSVGRTLRNPQNLQNFQNFQNLINGNNLKSQETKLLRTKRPRAQREDRRKDGIFVKMCTDSVMVENEHTTI